MSGFFRNLLSRANQWAAAQGFSGAVRLDAAKSAGLYFYDVGVSRAVFALTDDAAASPYMYVVDDSAVGRIAFSVDRSTAVVRFPSGIKVQGDKAPWFDDLVSVSSANPGGFVLPNGIKVQGGAASLAASQTLTVALPWAYSTVHIAAVIGPLNDAGGSSGDVSVSKSGLTGVTLKNNAGSTSNTCQWLSFGW